MIYLKFGLKTIIINIMILFKKIKNQFLLNLKKFNLNHHIIFMLYMTYFMSFFKLVNISL